MSRRDLSQPSFVDAMVSGYAPTSRTPARMDRRQQGLERETRTDNRSWSGLP